MEKSDSGMMCVKIGQAGKIGASAAQVGVWEFGLCNCVMGLVHLLMNKIHNLLSQN